MMIMIVTAMEVESAIGGEFAVMVIKAGDGCLHYGDARPSDDVTRGINCCIDY